MSINIIDKDRRTTTIRFMLRTPTDPSKSYRQKKNLFSSYGFRRLLIAILEATLNDGTRLTQKVEALRGTPRNPMTRQEVIDKATDLMGPILGKTKTKQLIRTVFELETLPRVKSLRALLQA
ncbi:MAG: hypothetical protein WCL48_11280 [Betaproteobacteria bacterium]